MIQTQTFKEKLTKILSSALNIRNNRRNKGVFITAIVLIMISVISFYFVSNDQKYYDRTIAKIIAITEKEEAQTEDMDGNVEQIKTQQMKAVIVNGIHKGEVIELQNAVAYSEAVDLNFKLNDEVFVSLKEDAGEQDRVYEILDFKRDTYISYAAILFILLILLIGGMKGFRSLVSVVLNIVIFSVVIELFLHGYNLILASCLAGILFTVVSIAVVSGKNKKSASAIMSTLAGTIISMAIAGIVLSITHAKGMYYEEMEFLTRPPEQIFMAEVLIGTLGGIMDIAISISSAIEELYGKNPHIERRILIKSGMEIGKDIMGTMSNTLFFAYISGSIPLILLWLKNGYSISYIVSINLSLELIRALTGSIGIVVSIPVTLYISVMLLKNKRMGVA